MQMGLEEMKQFFRTAINGNTYADQDETFAEIADGYDDESIKSAIRKTAANGAKSPRYTLSILKHKTDKTEKPVSSLSDFRTRTINTDEDHIRKKRTYLHNYDLPKHLEGDPRLKTGIFL